MGGDYKLSSLSALYPQTTYEEWITQAQKQISGTTGSSIQFNRGYIDEHTIKEDYQKMFGTSIPQPQQVQKEKKSMFKQVTDYVDKHRDVIFTLGFVILIDHFLFKGALKNRIQTAIEGVITRVENAVKEKPNA